MTCPDEEFRKTIKNDRWEIVTGLQFCERFLLRDPTQAKITNPDFDPLLPVSTCNPETIFPPLDLNNYTGKMDIRGGNTRDSELIHTIETGGAGMTINDPDIGFVTLFIDGSITGAEDPGIGDFAGQCAFYDLFLFPNQPGKKDIRLFEGAIKIIEATTNV